MATTKFVNRARMLTSTTGTGSSITLTTAVDGYFTLAEAGLQDGDVVDYIIEQGSDFEIQHDQTYSDDGMGTVTLSRGTPAASKVGGSAGTSQVELNGTAQVAIVAVAKSLDVSTFTDKAAPVLADLLWGVDSVTNERVKLSLANLFKSSTVNLQVFTSNGTYTPTAGMRFAFCIATGGGGGGGGARGGDTSSWNAAGGGGAGATAFRLFTAAEIGASQSVTVGSGGTAGSSTGGNGGNGGTTLFGSFLIANGGQGGTGANSSVNGWGGGGDGGVASGGSINVNGGDGRPGRNPSTTAGSHLTGGDGGSSWWGGSARGAYVDPAGNISVAGRNGPSPGAGGSGAVCDDTTSGKAGGAGAAGIVVVLEFC